MPNTGYRASGGQFRYRSANSTASAYAITTRRVAAPTDAGILLADANLKIIPTGGSDQGLRLVPIGKGANNSGFLYKVFLGWYALADRTPTGVDHVMLSLLCSGAATLSTSLTRPTASNVMAANEIRADGLTCTAGGIVTAHATALSLGETPAAYSPADDTEDAVLIIPDTYEADFVVIDDHKNASATEINWLVERWNTRT